MPKYIDEEAQESDGEEGGYTEEERKRQKKKKRVATFISDEAQESEGEDDEYNEEEHRRLKKLKQMQPDSSEEDEDEEDEAKIAEENKGFIDDDVEEEEEEGSGSGSDSEVEGKRKRDDDDDLDADNLDEDDLDLIEENIGVKIDRKKKFKRLKRIEDEDSDAEEGDAKTKIANEIFQGSGDEEENAEAPQQRHRPEEYDSEEEGEESDQGSFIVDDDGRPMQKNKHKPIFEDEGLEAARDIFGCDFDYGDFEQYEDWDEHDEDVEDEEYEDEDETGREVTRKPKEKRKTSKKSIYEIFEPSDLERGFLTEQDAELQKTDIPERFQMRQVPVTPTRAEGDDRSTDKELWDEAEWIYVHAFHRPFISNQEPDCEAALKQYEILSKKSYSLRLSMIEEKYSCLANNKLYSPKTQTMKEYEKSEHVKEKLLDYIRLNISSSSSSKQDFGDQWQDIEEERIKKNQVVNSNLLKTKKLKSKGVAKYSKLLQNENYNDDHYENDSISVDDIDKWGSSHESLISKNLSFETHAEIDIRNNVSKNSDVSDSRSENINKRKRGRPPKFGVGSHCSSKNIKKKRGRPRKFDVGSHCSSKNIKKRGRPRKFDVGSHCSSKNIKKRGRPRKFDDEGHVLVRLNISSSKQDFGDQWQNIEEERIKKNQVVNSNLLKTKKLKSKGVAKYSKLLQNENYNDDHYENDSISVDDIDKWGSSHESLISKNLSFETHAEIDIRNNVSKNSDVSDSRSENINKRKRGRPPKFGVGSHCSSKNIKKKRGRPRKFDVGSHCSSKNIKKRGRPRKFDVGSHCSSKNIKKRGRPRKFDDEGHVLVRLNISSSKQDFGDQWQNIEEERIKKNQVVNSNLLKTKKLKSKGVAKYSKLLQNENYNDDHYENDSISVDDIDKWGSSHESLISKNLSFETHAEIDIRNNVSKNSDVSDSRSENINKRKRGRPPKFGVGSHCSSKNIKKKRGRPRKFDVDVKQMHQNNLTKFREQESKKPSQYQNLRDKDAQLKNSQTDLNNSADNLEMTERENSFLTLDNKQHNKQQGNNTWSPKHNFKCNESQIKSNTNPKNLKIKLNEPNISQEKIDSETELFGKGNKIHMNELSASYLKNNFTLRTPLTTIEEEESFSQIGSSEKAGNINNYQRKLCKEIPTYNLNSNFGSNIKKSVVKTFQTTDNLRNETEINGNLNNREEITVSSHANVTERKNNSLELRLRPLRVEMLRNGTEINSRIDNKEEVNLVKKANLKPPLKSLEEDMRNRIEINGDLDKREEINVSSHTCPAERKIRSLKLRLKSSEGNVKNGTEINRNLNSQEQITVSFHTSPEERETRRLELRLKSSEENLKNRTERNRNLSNKKETTISSHTSPEERKPRTLKLRLNSNGPVINSTLLSMKREEYEMSIRASKSSLMKSNSTLKENSSNESRNPLWHGSSKNENDKTVSALSYERSPPISDDSQEKLLPIDFSSYTTFLSVEDTKIGKAGENILLGCSYSKFDRAKKSLRLVE